MDQTSTWERLRRHGPSWLLSIALHVAILVPLCMLTWAVSKAIETDRVISVAPQPAQPDVAGDSEFGGKGGPGAAAGHGPDDKAPGPLSDVLSAPTLGPANGGLAEFGDAPGLLADLLSREGEPGGGGEQAMRGLIRGMAPTTGPLGGAGGLGGRGGNLLTGASPGFGQMVGDLQGKGLDIVLVLDATDSMTPYIAQAKQRLQDVQGVVTGLVENTRFGIVAYKDYGDEYGPTAVKSMKLTTDAKAVRAFLDGINAGGGGDEPEPIQEALKAAMDKGMNWVAGRKAVIILVGDSTIHSTGRAEAFRLAKKFNTEMRGTINVIDTGGVLNQAARRQQVQPDLKRIAQDGGGSAFLLTDEDAFWRHMIVSVFGERFKEDVEAIVQKYTGGH